MLPQETTTIESFIESGKGVSITYFNLSFLDMMSNGTHVTILNAISDYMEELRNVSVYVKLTEEQQRIYFYKPKLLCYDVYSNPELYFVILLINDMADVKEFSKPIIRMLKKDHMNMLISYIYNAERAAMNAYNSTYDG